MKIGWLSVLAMLLSTPALTVVGGHSATLTG